MLAICVRLCSCLCIVSSKCFRSSHACHMCSVVFLPVYSLFKMFQKISCLPYVFDSVLACAKPAHARVSEALLPALRTLSLSFLTNSSSDSKAFQHFIAFSGSPNSSTPCFPFFDAKSWPQSQTELYTCTTVLHCGHTFLRRLSSTEKPQYRVLQVTWSHIAVTYVLRRGIRKHCTWRKWLTYRSRG